MVCRLFAGGNRIRTIGPALVKGLSAVADERCRTDKLDGVIKHRSTRETTVVGRGASLDGRLFFGGTDGSNPVPSSGESATNSSGGPDQQSRHPDNCKGVGAPDQGARSPHGVDGGYGSPDTRSRRAEPFANDARGSIAVCAPGLTVSWTKRGLLRAPLRQAGAMRKNISKCDALHTRLAR